MDTKNLNRKEMLWVVCVSVVLFIALISHQYLIEVGKIILGFLILNVLPTLWYGFLFVSCLFFIVRLVKFFWDI
jgi:hypothetical protein